MRNDEASPSDSDATPVAPGRVEQEQVSVPAN